LSHNEEIGLPFDESAHPLPNHDPIVDEHDLDAVRPRRCRTIVLVSGGVGRRSPPFQLRESGLFGLRRILQVLGSGESERPLRRADQPQNVRKGGLRRYGDPPQGSAASTAESVRDGRTSSRA
jgi:hypothetical protein